MPSAHSSSQNENIVSASKNQKLAVKEKQKLNFSRSELFHMKTRVCLKYFVNDGGYQVLPLNSLTSIEILKRAFSETLKT